MDGRHSNATYHTTVGDQTAKVQPAVAVLGALHGALDDVVLAEIALLDGLIDTNNILPDDTASTNVQVADLRVAHEALGKADSQGGSFELGEAGLALRELVHDRGLAGSDGVAILGGFSRRDTPAVNHDCTSARAQILAMRPLDIREYMPRRGCSLGEESNCASPHALGLSSRPRCWARPRPQQLPGTARQVMVGSFWK